MRCALYMVELTVRDLETALRWYRDVLGLTVALRDEAGRFALLESRGGRVALMVGEGAAGSTRLVFEVDDLDGWLERLTGLGVTAEGPVKESAEGYRRAVLRGPEGQAVVLFAWGAPAAPGAR